MLKPKTSQELDQLIAKGRHVLFFTADWCGDCRFIKPEMAAIELSFPSFTFLEIDRDLHLERCQSLGIFGIPSFVVMEDGQELARLVNKERKTKQEITDFLRTVSA